MKVTVFCDVTPYSLVGGYQHIGGTGCLHLKIRKGFSSEV
jgi:hypothetical protein